MRELVFSVSKIAGYIKSVFDAEEMLQNISVSGEVSGFSVSGGNAYFVLKDSTAQLNCVCFAVDLMSYIPKSGDSCIIKGSVGFYKKGGKLNFNVTDIKPAGKGDSHLKLLLLKDKLEKEGIFDQRFKKALPYYPQKIGVVTSSGGAVIHDIIKVVLRKAPQTDILIYPVRVQGNLAEKDISEGISSLDGKADLIIVARGGGSAEDLGAFNTERVARAVFGCITPVISAVGHETDYTLCDLAADVRSSTPTAAADAAVMDMSFFKDSILASLRDNFALVAGRFNQDLTFTKNAASRIFYSTENLLAHSANAVIAEADRISYGMESIINKAESGLKLIIGEIEGKSPLKTLLRGYSAVEKADGSVVRSVDSIQAGETIALRMHDGRATARITDKEKYKS